MKKYKRAKARKADHIGSLPDNILHSILSCLDSTEQVVRTSILSTRWKYLWTGVPSLNISFTRKVKMPYTLFHKNEFKEFVDRVLGNMALDLDSFSLKCPLRYDMSTIGHWIDLVVMKKVKQLDLAILVEDDYNMLPRCLVDCDSLKVLKLKFPGSYLSLESFTGSKTLKIFELRNVELLDNDLGHSFPVNCSSLEELSLINCSTHNLDYLDISCPNLKTLKINNQGLHFDEEKSVCDSLKLLCPKLVYLEYIGYMANHFSFDVKSLKKAVIEVRNTEDYMFWDENFVVDLFVQVSHVEHLSINHEFIMSIAYFNPSGVYPNLPTLKSLEIELLYSYMEELVCLLKCSPNLESFQIKIIGEEDEDYTDDLDDFLEVLKTGISTPHLKRVELTGFRGEVVPLAIARFLLEIGNGLEEMVFSWSNKDKYHTQSTILLNQVSNFYKASSSVKVITLLKDSSEK